MNQTNAAKQAAGQRGAALVEDGMTIGLGTGSTTAYALEALGERICAEGLAVRGVATSYAAEQLARQHGIPLTTFDAVDRLDLALDGADEVDPSLDLIKGRGAAHTREKIVANQADRFVVLADPTKRVEQLGAEMPVPVEVVPMAAPTVTRALRSWGAAPKLRMGKRKDGPVITDQGLWVIDAHFDGLDDPHELNRRLNAQPGVLDHGLFLDRATDVLIGQPDGTVEHLSR